MKVTRYSGKESRMILIGMVTNRTVLSAVAEHWTNRGLFDSKWENLIGGWCVEHIREYREAPGRAIELRCQQWADKSKDADSVNNLEAFLDALNDEYEESEQPSTSYIIDLAAKHFDRVRIIQAGEQAVELAEDGEVDEAKNVIAAVRPVEMGSEFVPLHDWSVWRDAFDGEEARPLLALPGEVGAFLNPVMIREGFVAITGTDKGGKSWWLLELAYQALRKRRRVAYFEAGDLSQTDIILRLGQRAVRRPFRAQTVSYPVDWNDDGPVIEERKMEAISAQSAFAAYKKLVRGRKDRLKLTVRPNSTLSTDGVDSKLNDMAAGGWFPDVVVVDYADIMAAPAGAKEPLQQIDETWKHLRRISQAHHCLVLTATQSSAEAYRNEGKLLRRRHFSGRKTKYAHVTAMLGLGTSEQDRKQGVSRINYLVRRSGAFAESTSVEVAGCLDVGRPCIISRRARNRAAEAEAAESSDQDAVEAAPERSNGRAGSRTG